MSWFTLHIQAQCPFQHPTSNVNDIKYLPWELSDIPSRPSLNSSSGMVRRRQTPEETPDPSRWPGPHGNRCPLVVQDVFTNLCFLLGLGKAAGFLFQPIIPVHFSIPWLIPGHQNSLRTPRPLLRGVGGWLEIQPNFDLHWAAKRGPGPVLSLPCLSSFSFCHCDQQRDCVCLTRRPGGMTITDDVGDTGPVVR